MKLYIFDFYNTLYDKKTGLNPYTKIVLNAIKKNNKTVLVTNEESKNIESIIDNLDIRKYFDLIISNSKSENDYLILTQKFLIVPKDFVFVDSNVKKGIKIANNIGAKSIWINLNNKSLPDDANFFPTCNVNSLDEIVKFID